MKWMLIVVVFEIAPVKTGLLFDSLDQCWSAREPIAREYADVANDRLRWANEELEGEHREQTVNLLVASLGVPAITCIPHAAGESRP